MDFYEQILAWERTNETEHCWMHSFASRVSVQFFYYNNVKEKRLYYNPRQWKLLNLNCTYRSTFTCIKTLLVMILFFYYNNLEKMIWYYNLRKWKLLNLNLSQETYKAIKYYRSKKKTLHVKVYFAKKKKLHYSKNGMHEFKTIIKIHILKILKNSNVLDNFWKLRYLFIYFVLILINLKFIWKINKVRII